MTKEPSNRSDMNGGETRSRTVWFLAHDLCPFLSLARLEGCGMRRLTWRLPYRSRCGGPSHHGDAEVPRPSSAEPLHAPWHFLYFFPLPQGQGSLRPTLLSLR